MAKKISLLLLLLVVLFCGGKRSVAAEQENITSDEKQVVFRLVDQPAKGFIKERTPPARSTQSPQGQQPAASPATGKREGLLPKTNDTTMLLLSFLGTLLVGLVLLIWWKRRREQDEEETKET